MLNFQIYNSDKKFNLFLIYMPSHLRISNIMVCYRAKIEMFLLHLLDNIKLRKQNQKTDFWTWLNLSWLPSSQSPFEKCIQAFPIYIGHIQDIAKVQKKVLSLLQHYSKEKRIFEPVSQKVFFSIFHFKS